MYGKTDKYGKSVHIVSEHIAELVWVRPVKF